MKPTTKQLIFFIIAALVLFGIGWYFGYESKWFGIKYLLRGLKNDRFLLITLIALVAGIWSAAKILRKLDARTVINSFWGKHKMKFLVFTLLLVAGAGTGTGFEDNHPRVWNIKLFGAKGDQSQDETSSIQAAINACSNGGGGDVYFPNGIYLLSSALDGSSNAQIYIPAKTDSSRTHIRLIGESRPNFSAVGGGLVGSTLLPFKAAVILKSTITTGAAGAAVIGCKPTNYTNLSVENLAIQVKNNPAGAGPVVGGIDGSKILADMFVNYCIVYVDTVLTKSTLPTNDVSGIITPPTNQAEEYRVQNTTVEGFHNGIKISEWAILDGVNIFVCYNGILCTPGIHANYVGKVALQWNTNDIKFEGASKSTLMISEMDVETISAGKWYDNAYTINDSTNKLNGLIFYLKYVSDVVTKNGGRNINAYSLTDSTKFALLNANNVYFNGSNQAQYLNALNNTLSNGFVWQTNGTNKFGLLSNITTASNLTLFDYTGGVTRMFFDTTGKVNIGGTASAVSTSAMAIDASKNINYTNGLGYWDAANGRFGIGTTSPGDPLHIQKSFDGNVEALVENTSSGTSAQANFRAKNNSGEISQTGIYNSNKTAYGTIAAHSSYLYSNGAAPMNIFIDANQPIIFCTGSGAPAIERMRITGAGSIVFPSTNTTTGTTGAQTINKPSGKVNFAASASTLVVTNSLVTTSSIVIVTVEGTDATFTSARVTLASGSFTITANATATAETKVDFFVIN